MIFRLALVLNLTGVFVFAAPLLGVSIADTSLVLLAINLLYLLYRWPSTARLLQIAWVLPWILFFLIWPVLSVVYASEIDIRAIGLQLYYISLVLGAAVFTYVSGWERFRRTVGVSIVITAVGLGLSLLNPAAFDVVGDLIKASTDYGGRAFGFFIWPNTLSANTILMFIIWLAVGRPRLRVETALTILVLLGRVGVTGSRGGFLTALTVVGVFGFDQMRRGMARYHYTRAVRLFAGALFAALVIGAVVLSTQAVVNATSSSEAGTVISRLQFLARGDIGQLIESDPSLGERFFALQQHVALIGQRPWTGYGLGAANRFWEAQEVLIPSHNSFVELAVNFGIPYVIFLILLLSGLVRNGHRSSAEQFLRSNVFAQFVLAIVLLGMADNTVLYSRTLIVLLGGLLGLLARQAREETGLLHSVAAGTVGQAAAASADSR